MKRYLLLALVAFTGCLSALSADGSSFKIAPTARALFDAAAYAPSDSLFRPGAAMPDVRLGAKANFGSWEARADVSYRFGKLYPADIYIQYSFTPNSLLKGGYFVHQFGLQSATGASHKISMEQPIAESAFGEPRLLGAMYVWHNPKLHFAGSLYVQGEAATRHANELGRTGAGGIARFAWHPQAGQGRVFQIGVTGLGQSPNYSGDIHNPVSTLKAAFPTKVSEVACLLASVDHVKSIFKVTPELLFARGRWAAEGQFYWTGIDRKQNFGTYNAVGGYALGRVLLNRNASYGYSAEPAYLSTPPAGSWEIVAGYSGASLNDSGAGIYGGKAHEATVTMNCYINRWITWRVNYAYTSRTATPTLPSLHANIFQTRLQFVF